ncbi:uncharacterized protein [Neodiprion pinetum]|uniref:uncharacterized protein isoform X1 n=1 Tax=Neodiprion pinetum TaxID=441929 RepID=UPI001EE01823|nr:uncharacterized protein LOC124214626 isoform X1 [Neodiprion pinetum]
MGDLLKKCQISAIEHAQWAIDPVFNGLETLLGTMKGTGHGCNDSQSLIDRCRVNASSGWVTLSESWFNTLRLLAVYTSTKDRQSTMNMSQIQMNEPLTNSRMSDAVRIIFDKISTALNNINSGNYSSSNYSIANYTDAVNETVNHLIGALDITFSSFFKIGASWTSQSARTEIIGCVRKSIEIVFEACQLAQCRDCKGFQAKIEEMEKQSASNYTAAVTKVHEFIGNVNMKDVRVDAIMKQCLKKSLERSQDSCKNIFDAIRILAGQISPSSRISSSRSVILLNNLRLGCNTNVKYRISFTYQAIQLRVVVSLIRKSKISDGFSLIEMQRQKAHAAVDKGFDVFFNEIRKNACSANYSGTDMIDSAANVTYTFFRVLTECAYYTMKTVIPETSSSVATVQGSTYAALNSMVGSLFTILRTIQQNELSGILQEMDIMKDTAVCLSHAVIDSWYVPLMKIAHQQNNTEMRYELNNTIFTLRNICSNVIETMVNYMKYYFQSTNNSISIEYQGTTSKQLFKPVTNSFFDDILLAFTADVMCNAKTTAHSC